MKLLFISYLIFERFDESFYPMDERIETAFDESTYLGVEAESKDVNEEES
jgi:hypothetical protein